MLKFRLLIPGLRDLWQHPIRLGLIVSGVALGSALCTFILLIHTITLKSFSVSVDELAGQTDLIVTAIEDDGFRESFLEKIQQVDGVRDAFPLVQNKAFVTLNNGSSHAMSVVGVDLVNDRSIRAKDRDGGRLVADVLEFLSDAKSIALTEDFATRQGLKVHDTLQIVTAQGTQEFRIRTLFKNEGPAQVYGSSLIVMDIESARQAFGKMGKVDQVNVVVNNRGEMKKVADRIQRAVGDDLTVEPPSSQIQSLREVIAPFERLLASLGALVGVMAFALITNTARVSISERKKEIGILRAIGMQTSGVITTLAGEYAIVGLVGSMLGSLSAWALARTFSQQIQRSMAEQAQVVMARQVPVLNLSIPLVIGILGALVTVLAVLGPIIRISNTSPVEAIVFSNTETEKQPASGRDWILCSLGAILLSPLLLPFSPQWWILQATPIVGALITAPIAAVALLRFTQRIAGRIRLPLVRLAWSYAVDKPLRVERTLRGIAVALLLLFVLGSVQAGFMNTLESMFSLPARPDFYVTSHGKFNSPQSLQSIDDGLISQLTQVAGVRGVFGRRIVGLRYGTKKIIANAYDEVPPETFDIPYSYFNVTDRPVSEAGRELYHSDSPTVMVSESFVALFGKSTGDTIELTPMDTPQRFRIVGVIRDLGASGGRIYLSRKTYKAFWGDPMVTGIAFVLNRDAKLTSVTREVEERFGKSHGLVVTIDRANRTEVEGILRRSFFILDCVKWVCIIVSALGFIGAFLIEIQNRTQELSILRIVGMSRPELSLFLILEAALLGAAASTVTLLLAIPVSWGLITQTLPYLFGWVVQFSISPGLCSITLLLGIWVPTLSSLYAVNWAGRLNITEVTQYE